MANESVPQCLSTSGDDEMVLRLKMLVRATWPERYGPPPIEEVEAYKTMLARHQALQEEREKRPKLTLIQGGRAS